MVDNLTFPFRLTRSLMLLSLVPMSAVWAQNLVPASPAPTTSKSAAKQLVVLTVGLDAFSQSRVGRWDDTAQEVSQRSGRFSLVRLSDALDVNNGEIRQLKLKSAESKWANGLRAYEELDTRKAADLFSEAVRDFKQTDLSVHFSSLSKAMVMKVASLLANGEKLAATSEMEKVLTMDPKAIFSPDYFPPDSIKQVEDLRRSLNNKSDGTMQINSQPSGAQVFLDGRFRGVTPLKLTKVSPGEHMLTVSLPGYELAQQPALTGVNELVLRAAEGQGAYGTFLEKLKADPEGSGRDLAAVTLCRAVKAEQVLLTLVKASTGGGQVDAVALRADCSDGHNWSFSRQALSSDERALREWDAFFTELFTQDVARQNGPVTHFRNRGPSVKATVGYVLLVGSAAMLAGGAVTGSLAARDNNAFRATPATDPNGDRLKKSGQTFGLTADLLFLGALLTGASGTFLVVDGSNSNPTP